MAALLLCERTTLLLSRIKINKTFGNAWRHEHLANGSNGTFKSKTIRQGVVEKLLEYSTVAYAGPLAGG
jgi:phage terminase large subunit